MKHLRKSILTLLALTLFGGAWAQNSWQSSSSQASNTVALADVTVTFNGDWEFTNDYAKGSSNGQTITIAPTADGDFTLVFGGSIMNSKPIHMTNDAEAVYVAGTKVGAPDVTVEGSGVAFASGEGVVYALEAGVAYTFSVGSTTWRLASFSFVPEAEPAQEIELTKSGANQWSLGQTPDYDLELQVEYYEAHALKNIPAGWTVLVNGVPQTKPYQGDSLLITETDSVTLIPDNPRRVKSVTLEEVEAAPAPAYMLLSAATTEDVGKVVCAAGHLHDAKTAVPDGCTAVGILGKVTETGHGLILALKNATNQNWNTINGWTSASYAGTTLKVLPDDGARSTNLASYTTLGETAVSDWAVAQKGDYVAIFTNLGSTRNSGGMTYDNNVNAYITTGVGGTAMSGTYWSATQDDDYDAWYFLASYWDNDYKTYTYYVRPVLGF